MSNVTPQKTCACGEPAMPAFDSCVVCYSHPQLVAAIERRVERRLLAALSRASDALSQSPMHDAARAALAVLAFGLGSARSLSEPGTAERARTACGVPQIQKKPGAT